jgi:HAMP domain-containing protein
MFSLAGVFVLLAVAINALLISLVIRPVNQLSKLATDVSMGNSEISDFPSTGKDEIGELSKSFNRMGRSLVEAMKMLRTS